MAVSPTKLSAGATGAGLVSAPPRDWEFLLTEANFYRSRDEITLEQTDVPWIPGSFVTSDGKLATLAADIDGILCAWNDTTAGPRMATVITRDAEVIDAYLQYGALVVKDVHTRLSSLAIIVRQAVLPNVAAATFDPKVAGAKMSGITSSPIAVPPAAPPAYPQPASFFPSTLEAAEPDMPAAGSPQPAPPTVPVVLEPQRAGESDEDFRARQEEHERQQRERDERARQEEEQRRSQQQPQGGAPPEAPRT